MVDVLRKWVGGLIFAIGGISVGICATFACEIILALLACVVILAIRVLTGYQAQAELVQLAICCAVLAAAAYSMWKRHHSEGDAS